MERVPVPFPTGLVGALDHPRQRERLINVMNDGQGALLPTPGVRGIGDGFGPCRAAFIFQEQLYHVSGERLIRVDENGGVVDFGLVEGASPVFAVPSFANVALIVKGGKGYEFNGSLLTEITDPNFITSNSATAIDGYFLYAPTDGGPIIRSDQYLPGAIPANGFFDAEVMPDRNTGVFKYRNQLYVFGAETIELFRNIGAIPAPFLRVDGGMIPVGYVSAAVEHGSSFLFLGKDESYRIFRMGSGAAQPISTVAIEEMLNQEYAASELVDVTASRFTWHAQDVAIFCLPRHTLAYNGAWFEIRTGAHGPTDQATWRVSNIVHAYGKFYCGDSQTGRIGVLADISTEYDEPIQRVVETYVRINTPFDLDAVELDLTTSGLDDAIGIQLSPDGDYWGPTGWIKAPLPGRRRNRTEWRYPGGLGHYDSYAGIRILTSGDIQFSPDGLIAQLSQ